MDPDWDDLKVFLAVARGESLSAAGKLLRRDAATVGRHVSRLEEALGSALFVRSPQGYALSAAGERLLEHAERVEQAVAMGLDALSGGSGGLSGQVRIGATDGVASYVLPRVCAAISARHPGLELQIVALPRVINLSRREADMAVTVSPPETGRLTTRKITDYGLHLVAARSYLARHGMPKSRADLAGHRFVGYIPDLIYYPELDFLSQLGIERIALASNLVAVQTGFLRAGGGLGVAHDFILPFCPELVPVLPGEVGFTRSFYLVRHLADARVERLAMVAEEIRRGVRAEVARLEALVWAERPGEADESASAP